MNQYEIAVLYDPQLEIDIAKAESIVEKIISENKGKITAKDSWGKRKLAYKIKGNDQAVYVFYTVDLDPANVSNIEQTLNITDEVIRFLIIKPDLKALAKANAEKEIKAQKMQSNGSEDSDEEEVKE